MTQPPTSIALGADHAGFALKEILKRELVRAGYRVDDGGVHSEEAADYPDISVAVARAVSEGRCERGVLVCGTGIGTQIAANKIRGIRACVCHDCYSARISRAHNDTNILCLGARVIGIELAKELVRVWLAEPFSGEERHVRRLGKIAALENPPQT